MTTYLRLGSFGEAVRALQATLNKFPSTLAQLKEDAQFGPKTHNRVVEFQNQKKLQPDGVAGPLTFDALEQAVNLILTYGIGPADEAAARDQIAKVARAHLAQWGGEWIQGVDQKGLTQKIAGKICIDETTRLRQGGPQIALFFSAMGVPHSHRCLTISKEAVAMYDRTYTAAERNAIDIQSWCGIFAFYIYKIAGLKKIPNWSAIKIYGVSTEKNPSGTARLVSKEKCHMMTTTTPKKGDIGLLDAYAVVDKKGKVLKAVGQNHHFIVTDVIGGAAVSSVDGNSGAHMGILGNKYEISRVLNGGGFYTPIWENCLG